MDPLQSSAWKASFAWTKLGPAPIGVPGVCTSAFVGEVKPINVGLNEPYMEPTELEMFVPESKVP